MSTQETLSNFTFESREEYDRAKKEADVIAQIQEKTDLSDAKTALKIYNKAVADKLFETPVGYCFLFALRQYIIDYVAAYFGDFRNERSGMVT